MNKIEKALEDLLTGNIPEVDFDTYWAEAKPVANGEGRHIVTIPVPALSDTLVYLERMLIDNTEKLYEHGHYVGNDLACNMRLVDAATIEVDLDEMLAPHVSHELIERVFPTAPQERRGECSHSS